MQSLPNTAQNDLSLRDELIDRAFYQSRSSTPMGMLAIIGIGVIHLLETGDMLAPAWLLGMLFISAARLLLLFVHARRALPTHRKEQLLNATLLLTSLGWFVLPFINFPGAAAEEKLAMVCIMCGMAAGATVALGPLGWTARIYLVCSLLPGSILIYDMPGGGSVLTALTLCFLAVMLYSHNRIYRDGINAIRQMQRNTRLIAEAQHHQSEVERLNEALLASQKMLKETNAELTQEVAERARQMQLAYSVVENTTEGVIVLDVDGLVVAANPAFTRLTGYTAKEMLGNPMYRLRSDRHDNHFYDTMLQHMHDGGKWDGELWSRRKDGTLFLERRSVDALRDKEGCITHFVSIFNDITDSHAKDEQLRHLAFHDVLTGLPNRALLQERVTQGIAAARQNQTHLAVLYLDLDQFKSVNDSLGHHIGDRLLQAVAERLKECLNSTDTLARIGGDEFVVVMNQVNDDNDCSQLAAKLIEAIGAPLDIDSSRIHVRTSIGIALFPEHGDDAKTLMRCADMAMYAAKDAGRNTSRFFHRELSERAEQRMRMETALREAIEHGQFSLHYQAKVDANNAQIEGYEALLRWIHPEWGNVAPDRFIPVAEDASLICKIGEWVIGETCAQLAQWHRNGHGWQKVAINVSARQLEDSELIAQIRRETQRHGVPCSALEFEITESVVMAYPEQTLPVLRSLRSMGLTIAIDDFGTGQSSLAYLRRLPIDVLKIDRAFVQDMDRDENVLAIVRTILSLSKTLHLKTVAEGVETTRQADLLRDAGCDLLQGYLFAKPQPATMVEATWNLLKQSGLDSPTLAGAAT